MGHMGRPKPLFIGPPTTFFWTRLCMMKLRVTWWNRKFTAGRWSRSRKGPLRFVFGRIQQPGADPFLTDLQYSGCGEEIKTIPIKRVGFDPVREDSPELLLPRQLGFRTLVSFVFRF